VRATATVESQPQPRNKHRKDQHLSRLSHCCETLQATCGRSKRGRKHESRERGRERNAIEALVKCGAEREVDQRRWAR
jgi:hypothetical protein